DSGRRNRKCPYLYRGKQRVEVPIRPGLSHRTGLARTANWNHWGRVRSVAVNGYIECERVDGGRRQWKSCRNIFNAPPCIAGPNTVQ
ncbi:MAG: hypothetical protein ACP5I8_01010, partial [Phycisphaerae bacterium]